MVSEPVRVAGDWDRDGGQHERIRSTELDGSALVRDRKVRDGKVREGKVRDGALGERDGKTKESEEGQNEVEEQEQEQAPETGFDTPSRWTPYRSVLRSISASDRRMAKTTSTSCPPPPGSSSAHESAASAPAPAPVSATGSRPTLPWRSKAGRTWLELDSTHTSWSQENVSDVSYVSEKEQEIFGDIVDSMFRGFADEPWNVEIVDAEGDELGDFEVDTTPRRGWVEGDREVVYDALDPGLGPSRGLGPTPAKSVSSRSK